MRFFTGSLRPDGRTLNKLSARMETRPLVLHLDIEVTPRGLMAIGATVSAILLSVVPIVWVSTRKLPSHNTLQSNHTDHTHDNQTGLP